MYQPPELTREVFRSLIQTGSWVDKQNIEWLFSESQKESDKKTACEAFLLLKWKHPEEILNWPFLVSESPIFGKLVGQEYEYEIPLQIISLNYMDDGFSYFSVPVFLKLKDSVDEKGLNPEALKNWITLYNQYIPQEF